MARRNGYGLHDSIGYWVGRLHAAMRDEFSRELAPHDATPPGWAVLNSLHLGRASTPGELAQHIGVDAAAVTRVLDRLEAAGLVQREPGPDRRSVTVKLTAEGRALAPKLARVARKVNERFLAPLTETEVRRFRDTISTMLEARSRDDA